jgi:hypothetical protein
MQDPIFRETVANVPTPRRRLVPRGIGAVEFGFGLGFALVVVGVALVCAPAALVLAGALLMLVAWRLA